MNELVIIRGYPGAGKTTFGNALAKKLGYIFIDHNEILTFIAGYTANDDGIYNEISALELAMTQKLLKEGKSVIVARGFSKILNMHPYINCAELNATKLRILRLEAPYGVIAKRVASPTRALDFNPTKNENSLKSWIALNPIEDFEQETVIDATLPIDELTLLN